MTQTTDSVDFTHIHIVIIINFAIIGKPKRTQFPLFLRWATMSANLSSEFSQLAYYLRILKWINPVCLKADHLRVCVEWNKQDLVELGFRQRLSTNDTKIVISC